MEPLYDACLADCSKSTHSLPRWASNPASKYLPNICENLFSGRNLYTYVYNLIHNLQNVELIGIFFFNK